MSNPRGLGEQELRLLEAYSHCSWGMTPQQFYQKWDVTYEQMAEICQRSRSTVQRWFGRGAVYRRPTAHDLQRLAVMDFLWEQWEMLPEGMRSGCMPWVNS
ncbi:MAG: helix-turn-helix domain-containing protein [Kamptonema sp. SIO4C4]|nr:helix-turn-helix domain-containing protein [Kamptonema sp. SIO4C4]